MPNTETIHLHMTPREADGVAYVLMAALKTTTMLARGRTELTATAQELFRQLGYGHTTDVQGNRIENAWWRA